MIDDPFDLSDPADPAGLPSGLSPRTPWLEALNPEQREAVTHCDGPVLVLSGAGTGKTRVLTARLAQILSLHKAQPWQVMAVTFTNKAAREMRERVIDLIGPPAHSLWLGTFHALAAKILRRHAELVGLNNSFSILDADDQIRLLKTIMTEEGIETPKGAVQAVMGVIQRWKDRGLTHDRLGAERHLGDHLAEGRTAELYSRYQQRLLSLNACDFGDLLLHNLTLFRENPEVLAQYQDRIHYMLVDEYQDTNVAQYLWLRLLAQKHKNICVVGDDDQSIYSWRGAEVGNILRFETDFAGAKIIRLERNYRSTAPILAAASHLIAHNSERLGKSLYPADDTADPDALPVMVRGLWTDMAEAQWLTEEIETSRLKGHKLSDIAVLVRTGAQTRLIEERLLAAAVPYRVIGGMRFYERQEIRDLVAYLRLIATPEDGMAFERIVNLPKRGLGDAVMASIRAAARMMNKPLLDAARILATTDELKPKPRAALGRFVADIDLWRTFSMAQSPATLAAQVMEESGYAEMWRKDKSLEAQGRLENLQELLRALEEFETLRDFLDHVALVMDNEAQTVGDAVTLMTLHAAKGLEFNVVFLPGWEEGLFPHQRALDDVDQGGVEEERRLAYVGITRARKRAVISFVARRRLYNQWLDCLPSRFLKELPQHDLAVEMDSGLSDNGAQRPAPSGGYGTASSWRDTSPSPMTTPSAFRSGDTVFHPKFGRGTVLSVDADRLEIAFDQAGTKRVLAGFVSAG